MSDYTNRAEGTSTMLCRGKRDGEERERDGEKERKRDRGRVHRGDRREQRCKWSGKEGGRTREIEHKNRDGAGE